jgi:hypothetical protein
MSSTLPGRRWASTRYKVGDMVKYQGRTWEVYAVAMARGRDKHPRPLYLLRAQYKPVGKRKVAYTYNTSYATNLKKA